MYNFCRSIFCQAIYGQQNIFLYSSSFFLQSVRGETFSLLRNDFLNFFLFEKTPINLIDFYRLFSSWKRISHVDIFFLQP